MPTALARAALVVANVCLLALASAKDPPLEINVREVTGCPVEHPNMPNKVNKMQLRLNHSDNDVYLDATLVVKETLDDPIMVRIDFYKCVEKEESSCNLLQTWERKTICDDIGKPDKLWSPMVASVQGFEPKCPVPAGTYKMADAPVTKAIRDNVKLTKGHWRIKATMIKDGKAIGCQRGYAEIKAKRKKTKGKNKS